MFDAKNTVAIDVGAARTKLAYVHPNANDTSLLIFSNNRLYTPTEFALNEQENRIFAGEDAERFLSQQESSTRSVSFFTNVKRDLHKLVLRDSWGRRRNAAELLKTLFESLREQVAPKIGNLPTNVYLTYPSTQKEKRVEPLKQAALEAGFTEVHLVVESRAAAQMAIAARRNDADFSGRMIVLDTGAYTVDLAYVRPPNKGENDFQISSSAVAEIGGNFIDEALVSIIEKRQAEDISSRSRPHVRYQVTLAKEQFCENQLYNIFVPGVITVNGTEIKLQKDDFETAINAYMDEVCNDAKVVNYIKNIKASAEQLPDLVLVGGCSQLPGFTEKLEEIFSLNVVTLNRGDFAAVLGAMQFSNPVDDSDKSELLDDSDKSEPHGGSGGGTQKSGGNQGSESGCAGILIPLVGGLLGTILLLLFTLLTGC